MDYCYEKGTWGTQMFFHRCWNSLLVFLKLDDFTGLMDKNKKKLSP